MKIIVNHKANNLASINHASGVITVNQAFIKLPSFTQKFILEHEKGHFFLNTKNEFLADKYAFNQLAGKEKRSLKNSIITLASTLPFDTKEHSERLDQLINLAALYDYENGNKRALKLIDMKNKKGQDIIKPFNVVPFKPKEITKENDGLNVDISVNDKEKDLLSTRNIIIGIGVIIILIFLFRSK